MSRRWLLGGVLPITALTGIYFAGVYLQSRAVGELAGTFRWARTNYCPGVELRNWMSDTAETLEAHSHSWRQAFNSVFIASSEKLNTAKAAVGLRKTCELYINIYEERMHSDTFQVGLWRIPVSAALQHSATRSSSPATFPSGETALTVERTRERLEACRDDRDRQLYQKLISSDQAVSHCRAQEAHLRSFGSEPAVERHKLSGAVPLESEGATDGASARTASSSEDDQLKFFLAVTTGNLPSVRQYLEKGLSANSVDVFGMSPLYLAQMRDRTQVMEELLRAGADPNVKFGLTWRSALHDAALGGRIDCVRILLKAGADPNITNKFGRTPLGFVSSPPLPLKSPPNSKEVVALLRQHGGK